MERVESTKYIFVSGGVMSGVGKGTATASIGLLLESAGFRVVPIKIDPYLNVDAGTMNPVEHGEVFVLDDGVETDQDLGNYERFMDKSLDKTSYTTSGQVYLSVINRERNLGYNGKCVETIPHIPLEVLARINTAVERHRADVALIEIGGTVGEYQNSVYFEANVMIKAEKPTDVLHIHLPYLPTPPSIGEMKSKPAQRAIKDLHELGIRPDIILARSEKLLDGSRRRKLAISAGMAEGDIISAPDVDNIYQIPINFEDGGLTDRILEKLDLERRKSNLAAWRAMVRRSRDVVESVKIGIVGKYFATGDFTLKDSYISVIEAVKHASWALGLKPDLGWINAGKIAEDLGELRNYQGIIVPGGFGSRDVEGKIAAIKFARESRIPYFGLCYGMQLATVEFARNVLGYIGAHTTEVDPETDYPLIHIMPDQEKKLLLKDYGGTMRLGAWDCYLTPRTLVRNLYGSRKISERHRHRYEFNNKYLSDFSRYSMKFTGTSEDGKLVEIIELQDHPFFIGTQFHPELKSRPLNPHPLFLGFIKAASQVTLDI